ncbi:MAG: ABC transporter ATP-binding protein [Pseudomonadota bacterium]
MQPALEIQNLQKTYASGHRALDGISLTVRQGDFFALLGKNGAGKSTVIGIVSSLVNKSGGTVKLFGQNIDENFAKAKSSLGIVPQEINFSIFETPFQIVVNQGGYFGIPRRTAMERAEQYLTQLKLWDKKDVVSGDLSGGMKRRLMIARALVHRPKLLILDEPTAGVDIEIRRSMWEFLKNINNDGTTIILTTHYLEEAESLCRNIAIIDEGVLIEDTSMRSLLKKLAHETYVLELKAPLKVRPEEIPGFLLLDPMTAEITIDKSVGISKLFETLESANIEVQSMRNKSNRLEQLFLELVENSRQQQIR